MNQLYSQEQLHQIEQIGVIPNFQSVQSSQNRKLIDFINQIFSEIDVIGTQIRETDVNDPNSSLVDGLISPFQNYGQPRPIVLTIDLLLKYHSSCGMRLSEKVKDRYNNVRSKNINCYVDHSQNKYVLINNEKVKNYLKEEQGITDPTKSFIFNFAQLSLLTEYSNSQSLFAIFDTNQTIKKNKGTKQLTREELEQVFVEMQFFKKIVYRLYENPLEAVLMAYMRNHNVNKIKQGRLDIMTINGIIKSVKILNKLLPNCNIDIKFSNEFILMRKKKQSN